MTSVFTAALCDQCGGSLDLTTLKCQFCNIPHFIDVARAIPIIAAELADNEYFPLRDRRTDAALLFAIQKIAVERRIELGLSLASDELISTIHVLLNPTGNGGSIREFLKIEAFLIGAPRYVIADPNDYHSLSLTWSADLLGKSGDRYYQLMGAAIEKGPLFLRGETNLAASPELTKVVERIFLLCHPQPTRNVAQKSFLQNPLGR